MVTAWDDEKTWPVLLYRRECDGWKKQEVVEESSSESSLLNQNGQYDPRVIMVAPRKGFIVFPDLHQKFSLESSTDRGTVIRRHDKILLVSKRRSRSLLLQFQSLDECLEFSDQFVEFNQALSSLVSEGSNDLSIDDSRHGSQPLDAEDNIPIVDEEGEKEVASCIVRMLHDETFLRYVHKIQEYIANTDDGLDILRGLADRELPPI